MKTEPFKLCTRFTWVLNLAIQTRVGHYNFGQFAPENLGEVRGKWFDWEMPAIESRYKDKANPGKMGDLCWFLQPETSEEHKRQYKSLNYF